MVQPGPPIEGPLAVGVECVCKRPAKPARGYPMGDVDNYAKGILDAATKAGVWVDDVQVVDLHINKRFAKRGEAPCVKLSITEE